MGKITENNVWHEEIYATDLNTPVQGGDPEFVGNQPTSGYANAGVKQVADRTRYLKSEVARVDQRILNGTAVSVGTQAELFAITDLPNYSGGSVNNDPDPTKNGDYWWDEPNSTWVFSENQRATQRDIDILEEQIDSIEVDNKNALALIGTPQFSGYEFYNIFPVPVEILDKAKVFINEDGAVIGSISVDGIWELEGIQNSDEKNFEFHNTEGVEQVSLAYLDSNNKIFASFDVQGNLNTLNGGNINKPSDKFVLNPLTQILAYIWYGQSLSNGSTSLPPISLSQPFNNLTFGAGPKATKAGSLGVNPGTDTIKPLVEDALAGDGSGPHGETSCSGFANYLSVLMSREGVSPNDLVIFSSTAGHGGYSITQLNKSSAWYQVWLDHVTEATLRAAELDKKLVIPALNWVQGESNRSMPMMQYVQLMLDLQKAQSDDVKRITGQDWEPPMLMYQTNSFNAEVDSGSSSAQLYLARNYPDKFKIVVPCFIFPNSEDGLHLTNVGSKWMGAYFSRAYRDIILNQKTMNYIIPGLPVKESLTTIRIPHTSAKPLQLLNRDITQHGYRVRVNGATQGVTVSLENTDIIITLNQPLNSLEDTVIVTYAREFKTSEAAVNIRQGDLCDTSEEEVTIDGISCSLRSWCPSYSEIAILNSI